MSVSPTELRTPMTVRGTPLTLMVWPTGSALANSSEAVSEPRTATAAWSVTSWLSRKRPSVIAAVADRLPGRGGAVDRGGPGVGVGVVGDASPMSDSTGATALMSGATTLDCRAAASASVRVEAVPKPFRTPLEEVVLPGDTVSRLVPRELMADLTWFWAPWPRPTVRMTAAMPIMMPSTVRPERRRWLRTASQPGAEGFEPAHDAASAVGASSPSRMRTRPLGGRRPRRDRG